jgi:2-oxoglutarate ferredoxin oxidoreductase subunit alpha
VIAFDHYPAEIRGFGKCISRTRISTNQVYSMKSYSDVLVSLNDLHAIPHVGEVRDYGAIIYDSAPMSAVAEGAHISGHLMPGHLPYALPIRELSELATGANRSRNIVALGFIAGLYQLPQQAFHQAIAAKFETKATSSGGYCTGCIRLRFQIWIVHLQIRRRANRPLPRPQKRR